MDTELFRQAYDDPICEVLDRVRHTKVTRLSLVCRSSDEICLLARGLPSTELVEIDLLGCHVLTCVKELDAAIEVSKLESLSIYGRGIENAAAMSKGFYKLKKLNIGVHEPLDDSWALALADILTRSKLEHLIIGRNRFSREGAAALRAAFASVDCVAIGEFDEFTTSREFINERANRRREERAKLIE